MSKENLEKAKVISEHLEKNTSFPAPVKQQIALGVALGVEPQTVIHSAVATLSHMQGLKAETENPKQATPQDYTETEQAIANMLTENTGAHILDSGGAYGRNWQRNRAIDDFRKLPACETEIHAPRKKGEDGYKYDSDPEILLYYNVFHYLVNFLELDETAKKLQKEFEDFSELPENEDSGWLTCMEKFAKKIDGIESAYATNTYNYENILSQTLQYEILEGIAPNDYIMLQIHNGCDVRGGYTKPQIFRIHDSDYFLMAQHDLNVSCKCGHCNGYSDDNGYNWHLENRKEDTDTQITLEGKEAPKKEETLFDRVTWEKGNKYGKDVVKCAKCEKPLQFFVNEGC